jgi:hypothetical protein
LIPSYGEKERLHNLLKTIIQDELYSKIEKIVVVSPDKRLILPKSKKIVLIREKERKMFCDKTWSEENKEQNSCNVKL